MLKQISISISDRDSGWYICAAIYGFSNMEHMIFVCVLFLCEHCLILFHYLIGCLIGYTLFLQFGTCFTAVVSLCWSRRSEIRVGRE